MRSRFCRVCHNWHDLSDDWPLPCYAHFGGPKTAGPQVVRDISEYQAMGVDVATGKAPRIGGRRQHRDYLKRNGYVEVGNEPLKAQPQYNPGDYKADVSRTIQQLRSEGRWK